MTDAEDDVIHSHNLKNIFRWRPQIAVPLKYPGATLDYRTNSVPIFDVRLVVRCEAKTTKEKEFTTFAEFVEFMKMYPTVAACLQFQKAWSEL
jgi:hypothetical protein